MFRRESSTVQWRKRLVSFVHILTKLSTLWPFIGKLLYLGKERMVRWNPPASGWFKLNTDGCSKSAGEKAGGGGVIRDSSGTWQVTTSFHLIVLVLELK